MDLKQRAKQLTRDIPAVYMALRKRETPWYAKALALITVGYALSPIDLIPDFIPILGYLDDLILLPMMVAATVKLVPADIMAQCRDEAETLWQNGKPKKWVYAIPIALVWIILVFVIIKAFI